jgi:hypothetical protein
MATSGHWVNLIPWTAQNFSLKIPGSDLCWVPRFRARQEFKKQSNQIHIERNIMIGTILLVLLIVMLIGAFPAWPHSRNWGYYPTGGLGAVLVIILVLMLLGRI